SMNEEQDDPGTTWNQRARAAKPDWMSPRMAWRAIQQALPRDAIISSDIGNNCAIGNAYPDFDEGRKYLAPGLFGPCGYGLPAIVGAKIGQPHVPVVGFAGDGAFGIAVNELTAIGRGEWPAITQIVFRNYQWGAEKRNSTVMAGTLIPASLVTGINSDLPGTIVAQVTQPVYDTVTGQYLLIPQGSRLIGRYQSEVSFGQDRALVTWDRIIFPDGSSIVISAPGADAQGFAGLSDRTDHHWDRVFIAAGLATILGIGAEFGACFPSASLRQMG
ncbi:MAG: TrbI/VirB10 family protein, partial [Pseudomonadota bacterium]